MLRLKYITKTVWVLSLVSLFTDTASEMLYPVMPLYLKAIGFSVVLIGILEGLAEAVAGLSKGYFGAMSDGLQRRVPFVQWGYALSALSKPMMAFFTYPLWVFSARTTDRLGKGIRTGARDAILSGEATPENKGRIFGFHRSMDTLGAVLGPLLALLYLHRFPEDYSTLFFFAFIPGLLAILFTRFLKEKKKQPAKPANPFRLAAFFGYWKKSPVAYRKVLIGLIVFAIINSSDVFLLLKAKENGVSETGVIGLYIFYNLVYALCAFPLGIIADKISLRTMLTAGIFVFSLVYIGMSLTIGSSYLIVLFLLYGVYAASTEGIAKAWISNLVPKTETATAIGTYSAFQSISAMIASSTAGLIWFYFGAPALFIISGTGALIVCSYFLLANLADQ